jgi:predicted DNA binding protein
MWVAKVKIGIKGTLIGSKAKKYNINLFIYPLSYYYEKDWIIVHLAGTIFGEKKKEFVKQLKKEERTVNFELKEDFFIGTIKEPRHLTEVYNKNILYLTPLYISDKEYELITIGSFQRKHLEKTIKILINKHNAKLISIQQKKIKSISVMTVNPLLTKKQKQAIELAIKNGYYEYPRKIELEKLAVLMKLSYSTYQAHLRKAEKKLIPFFFEKSK